MPRCDRFGSLSAGKAAMASESRENGTPDFFIRDQAAEHTLAANPLVGVCGHDILDSVRVLTGEMMKNPSVAAEQYLSFLGELGRIVTSGSELAPDAKDKRFADPAWKESATYRVVMQCYLAWSGALNRFVDEAKMDKRDAERVRFLVSLVLDAISPTNSLAGNPAALKKLIDTGGTSLVRGMENFITDLMHNGGLPARSTPGNSRWARTWRQHRARLSIAVRSWSSFSIAPSDTRFINGRC